MKGKFLKFRLKKVFVPALTIAALLSVTTPAFAMEANELVEFSSTTPMVMVEVRDYSLPGIHYAARITSVDQFTDAQTISKHWAKNDIQKMLDKNGIQGYEDGSFRPNGNITTAELLSILINTTGNKIEGSGSWSVNVMNTAYNLGIVTSNELPESEANKPISREKMAMVLVKSAEVLKGEQTEGIEQVDKSLISDLNQAGQAYQDYIRTAYSMGLLAGTGKGYNPKGVTTRAEACAITNRLMGYSDRVDNLSKQPAQPDQPEQPTQPEQPDQPTIGTGQPGVYTALPDGSNVGKTGIVYPSEGQVAPDGTVITRDPETGVLGYGNGQKGGIYLGITAPNGAKYEVGRTPLDSLDNMSGHYEKHGDYVYWTAEWGKIAGTVGRRLQSTQPNAPAGTVADLEGNIIPGGTKEDSNAFFVKDSDGNWVSRYKNVK